jgi:fimbrial chaperone protein
MRADNPWGNGVANNIIKRICALCAIIALGVLTSFAASAMEVQPLVIDLNGGHGHGLSATFQIRNRFQTALPVEIRVQEVGFHDGGGIVPSGRDPGDLLVFPAQAVVEPGRTQNVRIQFVGDPELARSKHYYVTVAQLPVPLAPGQSGIQILYSFQVLVSVAARNAVPQIEVVSVERGQNEAGHSVAFLTVVNRAQTYGYLSQGRFHLTETDAAGHQLARHNWNQADMLQAVGVAIVGPGQRRRIGIPLEFASANSRLTGQFDYAPSR